MSGYSDYNSVIAAIRIESLSSFSDLSLNSSLQFEPAVVLDVILDDSHPIFKTKINC